MKNTYWEGKKTESLKMLSEKMVSRGYTENKIYNAFIAASKIYYDMYNNGGCNLYDYSVGEPYLLRLMNVILEAGIGEKFGNVKLTNKPRTIFNKLSVEDSDGDYVNLELFMDELIEEVSKNDFSFETYYVWLEPRKNLLSYSKKTANYWMEFSFGAKEELDEWLKYKYQSESKVI